VVVYGYETARFTLARFKEIVLPSVYVTIIKNFRVLNGKRGALRKEKRNYIKCIHFVRAHACRPFNLNSESFHV